MLIRLYPDEPTYISYDQVNNTISISSTLTSIFGVDNNNILYGFIKNNPSFRIGTTNLRNAPVNLSNLFRYST